MCDFSQLPPLSQVTDDGGDVEDTTLATAVNVPTPGSFDNVLASLPLHQAAVTMWKYVPPVLLVSGTFGNVMTLWILTKTDMCSPTVSLYLKALAASDLLLLYSGLLRNWINYSFDFEIRNVHPVVCKAHIWVVYVSGLASAWFLVAMTLQRAFSVVWPHSMKRLFTPRAAGVSVGVIVVLSFLFHSHIWYGYTVAQFQTDGPPYCSYLDAGYETFARGLWPLIDIAFSSLLPFAILIASNSMLIWKVAVSVREIKSMSEHDYLQTAVSQRKKMSVSITLTLICLSSLFLLLTSPICVYLVMEFYFMGDLDTDPHLRATTDLLWAVSNLLWYTNSCTNFYLYCLSGNTFRQRLRKHICCFSPSKTSVSERYLPSISQISARSIRQNVADGTTL